MANDDLITVVVWNPQIGGPLFSTRSDYVEQCWTPLLGPTSVLLLRALEPLVSKRPTALSVADRAARLGVGTQVARNALLRLKNFSALTVYDDGTVGVRTTLGPLSSGQANRIPATVRAVHERHLSPGEAA